VIQAPGPVAAAEDDVARAYLEAAEILVDEQRLEPARVMLRKAGDLRIRRLDLLRQLARLRQAVIRSPGPPLAGR
jgi:hypothetical protein